MKRYKYPILFITFGLVYVFLEVFYHSIVGDLTPQWKYLSFIGYTSLWVFPIGAICGVILGMLNELKHVKDIRPSFQCIIGTILVLIIEYFSGYMLNMKLGLNIWDYSFLPLQINGQISLLFALLWFCIAPLALWLDEFIKWVVFDEVAEYKNLFKLYKQVFTFKKN